MVENNLGLQITQQTKRMEVITKVYDFFDWLTVSHPEIIDEYIQLGKGRF